MRSSSIANGGPGGATTGTFASRVNAYVHGELGEIGDGGFTDWTAGLIASKKERLLISGLGMDRLATMR